MRDVIGTPIWLQILNRQLIEAGRLALNRFNVDRSVGRKNVLQHLSGKFFGDRLSCKAMNGGDLDQCSFQLSNVLLDVAGNEHTHTIRKTEAFGLRLFFEDFPPSLEIRFLDVGYLTHVES